MENMRDKGIPFLLLQADIPVTKVVSVKFSVIVSNEFSGTSNNGSAYTWSFSIMAIPSWEPSTFVYGFTSSCVYNVELCSLMFIVGCINEMLLLLELKIGIPTVLLFILAVM